MACSGDTPIYLLTISIMAGLLLIMSMYLFKASGSFIICCTIGLFWNWDIYSGVTFDGSKLDMSGMPAMGFAGAAVAAAGEVAPAAPLAPPPVALAAPAAACAYLSSSGLSCAIYMASFIFSTLRPSI